VVFTTIHCDQNSFGTVKLRVYNTADTTDNFPHRNFAFCYDLGVQQLITQLY